MAQEFYPSNAFQAGARFSSKGRRAEEAVTEKRTAMFNDAIKGALDLAASTTKAYQEGQTTLTPEQFAESINSILTIASRSSEMGTGAGLNVAPPELIEQMRGNLLKMATQKAVAQNKGVAEGASRFSQAQEVTQSLTPGAAAPSQEALYAANALQAPPASGTTVNVSTGDNAFNKERGKQDAQRLAEIQVQADDAEGLVNTADQFLSLAKDVETGSFAPAKYEAAAWVESLGLNPSEVFSKEIGAAQALDAVGNQLALKLRKEMPGQLSDQDRKFLIASNLSLRKTTEGNAILADAIKAVAQRKVQKGEAAQQWADQHGNMTGFTKYWNDYINSHPLFDSGKKPEEIKSLSKAGQSAFDKYKPK